MNAKLCKSCKYSRRLKLISISDKKLSDKGVKIITTLFIFSLNIRTNQTKERIYIMKGDFNTESAVRKQ